MMIGEDDILKIIPHQPPFRFVDGFDSLSDDEVVGHYTFRKDEYFYQGHFPGFPVTPGVVLTECMAQIGVLGLGIYAFLKKGGKVDIDDCKIFITSNQIDFIKPVFPGEKIKVVGQKDYFRFSKMKVQVKALNENEEVVAKGTISGVFIPKEKEDSFGSK